MVKRVLLVAMTVAGAGIVLTLFVKLMAPGPAKQRQVRLSDGRLFRIEAVTFGTNHVVGWVYARDASGKYVDCQGVRASFVDDQGDVYPANGYANGSFSKGFSREA